MHNVFADYSWINCVNLRGVEMMGDQITALIQKSIDAMTLNVNLIFNNFRKDIEDLEKRIASLESKPLESHLSRTWIDFEGDGGTKVPTGENESHREAIQPDMFGV